MKTTNPCVIRLFCRQLPTNACQCLSNTGASQMIKRQSPALLQQCAEAGDVAKLNLCLSEGWRLAAPDSRGHTALHAAACAGQLSATQLLLSDAVRADANAMNRDGRTPTMLAAARWDAAVLQAMVAGGGDVGMTDGRGWNALFVAIDGGAPMSFAGVRALLRQPQLDVSHRDAAGRTAEEYAREKNQPDLADAIREEVTRTPCFRCQ